MCIFQSLAISRLQTGKSIYHLQQRDKPYFIKLSDCCKWTCCSATRYQSQVSGLVMVTFALNFVYYFPSPSVVTFSSLWHVIPSCNEVLLFHKMLIKFCNIWSFWWSLCFLRQLLFQRHHLFWQSVMCSSTSFSSWKTGLRKNAIENIIQIYLCG